MDVVIAIRQSEGIEVWSSPEHRYSGPNENKESERRDLSPAIESALNEMSDWDSYLE